jgi:hypothetical protein
MEYAWGTKRVTMEVTRVEMDAAPVAQSNPHTSVTIPSLMQVIAPSVSTSAVFVVIIIRVPTVPPIMHLM